MIEPQTPERQALARAIVRHDALIERLATIKDDLVTTPMENRYIVETKHDEIVALADKARTERFRCVDVVIARVAPGKHKLRRKIFEWLQSRRVIEDQVSIGPSAAVDKWERFRRELATNPYAPRPE